MFTSNEATNIKDKDCSGCRKSKPILEFTRQREDKLIAFNFKNSKEKDGKVEFSIVVNIKNKLVNKEALLLEIDFKELLSPELDYENMLSSELDHEDMLLSELDQDEMSSLELDKSDEKKIRNIIKALLFSFQEGSKYYWELSNLYMSRKNG
ncbi:hypothetical protein C2G38_2271364 [Gigaspora rosea]|uniref:Uncharacterized protein n=1 Tax=Gigaspora rosea TaxID=44941 RepID=A0A397UFJ0_9GLOM|nr:hypothetical protein C2G38_2271364 [Gigaspora rosea]